MEDKLYKYLRLYKKSPLWFKYTAGSLYGSLPTSLRYGSAYTRYQCLASQGYAWTKVQHREFQTEKLKALITHAYNHVPFYRKKYQQQGVIPNDFCDLEDIKKFPSIRREEIKSNLSEFLACNIDPSKRLYTSTSGSSGVPLELFLHKGISRPKERGFLHTLWHDLEYDLHDRVVILRGEVINNEKTPWYYDPIDKHLIMSSYLLNEENIHKYCRQIRKIHPAIIRGYPFTVYRFVRLMQDAGEAPFPLKGIILESENVYPAHLAEITAFFKCHVCHYYGHSEKLVFGGNCTYNDHYHMHPEYGFMEVVDEDNHDVSEGEEGEIVATGFDNLVMPLIRYHTQDFAVKGHDGCECGLQFPILKGVMGRAEEYVTLNNGRKIPFHNILAGIHSKMWSMIDKLQFMQKEPGKLEIHLIPSRNVEPERIVKECGWQIEQRVGNHTLTLVPTIVDYIPITRSGKTKLFVQELSNH